MRFQRFSFSQTIRPSARGVFVALAASALVFAASSDTAFARSRHSTKEKPAEQDAPSDSKHDAKTSKSKDAKGQKNGSKPEQIGAFGDWNAFATQGSGRTCYALASPKDRQPKAKLKDTTAYVFISSRPGEGVKNEVAINLGYPTKDNSSASADIDGDGFELVTKGTNAWVKNPAKEKEFVETMKSGSKLIVKASSSKGVSSTDGYSLKGLSEALAKVQQECK